jgi:regulator of replication initiation timing
MAKNFRQLREAMSPEAQARSYEKARAIKKMSDKNAIYWPYEKTPFQMIGELRAEYNDALKTITDMQSMYEKLAAENKRLKREVQHYKNIAFNAQTDAERYRWGIANPKEFYEACQRSLMSCCRDDEEIDEAMKK